MHVLGFPNIVCASADVLGYRASIKTTHWLEAEATRCSDSAGLALRNVEASPNT